MIRYARKLVSDIAYVEKQNYSLPDTDHVLKFTFEFLIQHFSFHLLVMSMMIASPQ